jgi:predicted MFS family arabinose efflux permease
MLGYGGVFTSYVYLAPQFTEVTGLEAGWVTPLLLLFSACSAATTSAASWPTGR